MRFGAAVVVFKLGGKETDGGVFRSGAVRMDLYKQAVSGRLRPSQDIEGRKGKAFIISVQLVSISYMSYRRAQKPQRYHISNVEIPAY